MSICASILPGYAPVQSITCLSCAGTARYARKPGSNRPAPITPRALGRGATETPPRLTVLNIQVQQVIVQLGLLFVEGILERFKRLAQFLEFGFLPVELLDIPAVELRCLA